MSAAIEITNLRFAWPKQTQASLAFEKLSIEKGKHCFLEGKSGSGKTTLLNIMAGIFPAQQGEIQLLDTRVDRLSNQQKDRFRADHMGIIFQQFNLLPYLTVEQNILLPLRFSNLRQAKEPQITERLAHLLETLQLPSSLREQSAKHLSIGQQQRVAVARAMIGKPEIILADEPTSALDTDNRDRFIQELFRSAEEFNSTVVFVSHDRHLAQHFGQQINLNQLNQAGQA